MVTVYDPELHCQVNVAAAVSGKSLNGWVTEQRQAAVQRVAVNKAAGKKTAAKQKAAKKASKRNRDVNRRA